jgi:hypothetical protein
MAAEAAHSLADNANDLSLLAHCAVPATKGPMRFWVPGQCSWQHRCTRNELPAAGITPARQIAAVSWAPPTISKEKATMTLFSRAHDIISARTNKALDSAENPNEMLDYSYQQMLGQITRVRQALVDIATSRRRIELQEQQLQHTLAHLQDQAQGARPGP